MCRVCANPVGETTMNKKIVIGVALIAMGAAIYFICRTSDDGTDKKSALLMNSPGEKSSVTGGETTRTFDSDHEGVTDEESTSKKAAAGTVSFFVPRERQEYTLQTLGNFRRMSATTEMTGYVGSFSASSDITSVTDQSKLSNVISILLPGDVGPGTYNEKSANFMVQLFGQEAGTLYSLDHNCSFTLTVDEWGGPGGRVRGTFSGELKTDGGTTLLTITDGRFEAGIQ
jgi:hypothetical protein